MRDIKMKIHGKIRILHIIPKFDIAEAEYLVKNK